PQADPNGERGEIVASGDVAGSVNCAERVGDANARAHETLQLLGKTRRPRRATGDEDLREGEGVWLRLVELKRRDEFARERRQLGFDGVPRPAGGRVVVEQRETELDLGRLVRGHAELAGDGSV